MAKRTSSTNAGNSKKSFKTSQNASPSQTANAPAGWTEMNCILRSPLRCPLSLLLIKILSENVDDNTNVPQNNADLPQALLELYNKDISQLNRIRAKGATAFTTAMENWDVGNQKGKPKEDVESKEGETDFTDTHLIRELKEAAWEGFVLSAENKTQESQDSVASLEINMPESQVSVATYQSAEVECTHQSYHTGCGFGVDENVKGHGDILLFERSSEQRSVGSPINLMEVGLTSYNWWTKVSQGLNYVAMERNPTSHNGKADQEERVKQHEFTDEHPMLLSSIIVSKDENNIDKVSGEFGLFLCVPVPPESENNNRGSFRAIFLWRQRVVENKDLAAQAFGKIIQASYALYKWRKQYYEEVLYSRLQYEYLGPNCARFGDRIYRSYDTRLRPTDRSPELYIGRDNKAQNLHWFPREKGDNMPQSEVAMVVLDIPDDPGEGKEIVEFGQSYGPETDDKKKRAWLWENKGRLLIISVPYRKGGHVATHVSDFLPVFHHLEHIHDSGMVHGDVRGFNIVFGEKQDAEETNKDNGDVVSGAHKDHVEKEQNKAMGENEALKDSLNVAKTAKEETDKHKEESGELCMEETETEQEEGIGWTIDLDFGGVAGVRKYPKGFNFDVGADGDRRPKKCQDIITAFNDYYALWNVIERAYCFDVEHLSEKKMLKFAKDRAALEKTMSVRVEGADSERNARDLIRKFLQECGTVILQGKPRFLGEVERLAGPPHVCNPKNNGNDNNDKENGKKNVTPYKNANTKKPIATGSLK